MVRNFYLENEKGQKYDLMDKNSYCFLNEPSGLGYSYSTDYLRLGDTFVENIRTMEKGLISGTLITPYYDNINNFINFIEQSETLKFVYKVPYEKKSPITYYKDVKIASLEKGEKDYSTGMLQVEVTFDCLSLWYEKNEILYNISPSSDEICWDFKWDSKFPANNIKSLVFNNEGHTEAPFTLEMSGYLENPCISIYVNGSKVYSLAIAITLQEYEKLLYSTVDNDIYLYKENIDGTYTSLFINDYIDISKDNIFKLPKGVSEIRLTADSDILDAKLSIMEQFKAV